MSFSDAFFQDTKTTPQPISTDGPPSWLQLYPPATDPVGLTIDGQGAESPAPVPTDQDDGLTVEVGEGSGDGASPVIDGTLVLEAADPFPDSSITEIEVDSAVENDGGAPAQPLQHRTLGVTLAAGERREVDFQVSTAGLEDDARVRSTIVLTIHLDDGSEFEYPVPVDVCAAPCP